MTMKPGMRKTDIIGLVGVLLMVGWAPSYMAADDEAKALAGGHSFTLPYPRDGDRLELDMVVSIRGDDPVRLPGILTLRVEDATDVLGRNPDVNWSLVVEEHPQVVEFDPVAYRQEGRRVRTDFGVGGLVTYREQHTKWVTDDDLAPEQGETVEGRSRDECLDISATNTHAGLAFHYASDALGTAKATLRAVTDGKFGSNDCGLILAGVRPAVLTEAVDWEGHVLYGRPVMDVTQQEADVDLGSLFGTRSMNPCDIAAGDQVLAPASKPSDGFPRPWYSDLRLPELRFARGVDDHCDVRAHSEFWHWIDPRFPVPVGIHRGLIDENGTRWMAVDLLPAEIVRGNGPDLPVASWPSRGEAERARARQAEASEPVVATIPVRQLASDEGPWIHGWTFPMLLAMMAEEVSAEDRQYLDHADLVGFAWDADPIRFSPEAPEPPPLSTATSLPAAGPRARGPNAAELVAAGVAGVTDTREANSAVVDGPVALFSSSWTFIFLDADGVGRTFWMDVRDERPGLGPRVDVGDACLEERSLAGQICPGDLMASPDDEYVSPRAMLEYIETVWPELAAARADSTHHDSSFDWSPLDPRGSRTYGGDRTPEVTPGGGGWEVVDRSVEPTWRSHSGSFTGETGAFSYLHQNVERGPAVQESTVVVPQATTATPQVLVPHSTQLVLWGAALVGISFMVRAWALAKGAAPVAFLWGLYARIQGNEVLESRRREELMALVRANPGMTAREIQKALDLGWGSTVHHIETLRKNEHLVRLTVGRNTHHFAADAMDGATRVLVAHRRDPDCARLLDAVLERPGMSLAELAVATSRGSSGVSRTASRLARAGLLEKRRDGRVVRFHPVGRAYPGVVEDTTADVMAAP